VWIPWLFVKRRWRGLRQAQQAKEMTVGSCARRVGQRQWDEWLGRLTADQVEHVLLSLADERRELSDKLRRLRAELRLAESERDRVKLRTRRARRRLARLNKVAA